MLITVKVSIRWSRSNEPLQSEWKSYTLLITRSRSVDSWLRTPRLLRKITDIIFRKTAVWYECIYICLQTVDALKPPSEEQDGSQKGLIKVCFGLSQSPDLIRIEYPGAILGWHFGQRSPPPWSLFRQYVVFCNKVQACPRANELACLLVPLRTWRGDSDSL